MTLVWDWRGRMGHAACADAQRSRRDAVIAGDASEVVWLVEHPATITVGRRPAPGTPTVEELAAVGVAYSRTERGGLATYHGPGQLVAYPIVSLPDRGFTVRAYVHRLEQVLIDYLATLDVRAVRREGARGVYVGDDKIAAIGVHIRRGVSMHGLALNVAPNLEHFDLIVPCGLTDVGVTSLSAMGVPVGTLDEVAADLGKMLAVALHSH